MMLWLYRNPLDKIGVQLNIVMSSIHGKECGFLFIQKRIFEFTFCGKNAIGSMPQLTSGAPLAVSLFRHFFWNKYDNMYLDPDALL